MTHPFMVFYGAGCFPAVCDLLVFCIGDGGFINLRSTTPNSTNQLISRNMYGRTGLEQSLAQPVGP